MGLSFWKRIVTLGLLVILALTAVLACDGDER